MRTNVTRWLLPASIVLAGAMILMGLWLNSRSQRYFITNDGYKFPSIYVLDRVSGKVWVKDRTDYYLKVVDKK